MTDAIRGQAMFTPGPWRVATAWPEVGEAVTLHIDCIAVKVARDDLPGVGRESMVAVCGRADGEGQTPLATREANARLIAAAPDLLAACEDALAYLTDELGETAGPNQPVSQALADAIAKAALPRTEEEP